MLLSYGINDCEAKLARMPMDAVWTMLSPLVGETDVWCVLRGPDTKNDRRGGSLLHAGAEARPLRSTAPSVPKLCKKNG